MADRSRVPGGNDQGLFFVDDTCIDCDLCREIAPTVFVAAAGQSVVGCQPSGSGEQLRASMALVACPTGSIGTRAPIDLAAAKTAFPYPIEDGVYACGYASRDSYGAKSYLIVRPEGNVLVDSPRFSRPLVRRIESLGGVRTMFMTHRDDVADHEHFASHFACERVMHSGDAPGIRVEHLIEGDDPVEIDPGLTIIPTPGHTRGHAVLLHQNRFLFSGDHLAWSEPRGHLIAFRTHNWYSWPETIRSMERLTQYRFEWVLPGHGRPVHFPPDRMSTELARCVEWMKQVA